MHHILGNKILEYDVDDRGVIIDEREIDRTVNHKPNIADVTITVVDVNGAPIENATVTIEGLQYNTLSDGTVKVVGIANSTMSISVTKDGYMPYSNNEWKFANSRIILEVINNIIIMEDGNNILLENNNLILIED